MIYDEVLNHLNADELRNLVKHYSELDVIAGELNFAKDELIETLQRAYNNQIYMNDKRIKYTCKQGKIRKIEEELHKKYDEYIPKPICEAKMEIEK